MRISGFTLLCLIGFCIGFEGYTFGQNPNPREVKVRADKARVEAEGFWLYNDLPKAIEKARETGKPILVALRCIPCEECVKLDDELIDTNPELRPLLDQFVCVRVVGTNGLDLDTFQYDTDQSFAMFMLNADKTIYGRFGTRSHRTEWVGDVSIDGMARALEGALELHAEYPANKSILAAKRGQPLEFASPEMYPSLRDKYNDQLNYAGDVVKSCIHCHQIGDARRDFYWSQSKPIPEQLLFPYPHPKSIGLILNPTERALLKSVVKDSLAEEAGIQAGDRILTMNQQPILSMADVQWVLHQQDAAGSKVALRIQRGDELMDVDLQLPAGWRRADDTSWRVASWGMRGIATGGMRLVALTDEERRQIGIADGMALKVLSVGRFGKHAAAKNAGFLEGDVIVKFDGQNDLETEQKLFTYVNGHHKPGDRVEVRVLRNGASKSLTLPVQE
ncbi:MAG: PDZ domain-containing protein [Planctomycetales bacterium]|nr:PDZ domain-containing protein [Planctomycetales bacterium]